MPSTRGERAACAALLLVLALILVGCLGGVATQPTATSEVAQAARDQQAPIVPSPSEVETITPVKSPAATPTRLPSTLTPTRCHLRQPLLHSSTRRHRAHGHSHAACRAASLQAGQSACWAGDQLRSRRCRRGAGIDHADWPLPGRRLVHGTNTRGRSLDRGLPGQKHCLIRPTRARVTAPTVTPVSQRPVATAVPIAPASGVLECGSIVAAPLELQFIDQATGILAYNTPLGTKYFTKTAKQLSWRWNGLDQVRGMDWYFDVQVTLGGEADNPLLRTQAISPDQATNTDGLWTAQAPGTTLGGGAIAPEFFTSTCPPAEPRCPLYLRLQVAVRDSTGKFVCFISAASNSVPMRSRNVQRQLLPTGQWILGGTGSDWAD